MKTSSLVKFAALAGTLALSACRPDPLGSTGVQLDLTTTDSRVYASYFILSWMDEQKELFEVRVPDGDAFIDAEQAPVVSVFIALDRAKVGRRRALVRGYNGDGQIISEGAATLDAVANVWLQLPIKMGAFPSLPDTDGDGIPDPVDNCPRERDPCTGAPPPEADAGVDGGDDSAADASPDLPPDATPDRPVDKNPIIPTGFADAALDLSRH